MVKRSILVVEDELIVALEIKKTLLKLGYTVAGTEKDGLSAVETAGRTLPDLILMDIRLKGEMDGIEAAQRIRSLYRIPVIFLTAHSDEDTLSRALNTHPCGYLVKPFRERELYQAIEMGIHKHQVLCKMTSGQAYVASPIEEVGGPALLLRDDGKVSTVNAAFTTLTGLEAGECTGRPLSSFICPDGRDGSCILPDQMVIRSRDGKCLPISVRLGFLFEGGHSQHLVTLTPEAGSPSVMMPAVVLDGCQLDFRAVLDTLHLPVLVVGDDFRIRYFNDPFGTLLRYARISQYQLTRPVYEIEAFSLFGTVDEFRDVMRTGYVSTRVRRFRIGGQEVAYQFVSIPMQSGGSTMVTTVIHDLTGAGSADGIHLPDGSH